LPAKGIRQGVAAGFRPDAFLVDKAHGNYNFSTPSGGTGITHVPYAAARNH
jgi:hypothetical protein